MLIHMNTSTGLKDLVKKIYLDKKCFFGSLKDETTSKNGKKLNGHVTDEEYLTCIKIQNEFNMENMGDYRDHYLKKDVLLLADVLEKFIDTCLKFQKLHTCINFSSSKLSWNAMLQITGAALEKISNIDMYLFIEKGLRGGILHL